MSSRVYFCACSIWRSCVNKIYNKNLLLLISFYFIFVTNIFDSLSNFSANIFFMNIVFANILFCLSGPANIYIFHSPPPPQENYGPSLIVYRNRIESWNPKWNWAQYYRQSNADTNATGPRTIDKQMIQIRDLSLFLAGAVILPE